MSAEENPEIIELEDPQLTVRIDLVAENTKEEEVIDKT